MNKKSQSGEETCVILLFLCMHRKGASSRSMSEVISSACSRPWYVSLLILNGCSV